MKHQLCNGHKVSGYRWNWILLKFPVHLWSVENWSYFLHSLIIIVMNSKNARRRRLWTEAPTEFCAIRSSQSQLLVHSSCPPPRRVFQLVSYSVDPKECINPSAGSSVGRTDGWIASQPASQWRIRIEEEQRHQHQCDKEWISMSHCCWTNCHSFILHVSSTWNASLSPLRVLLHLHCIPLTVQ